MQIRDVIAEDLAAVVDINQAHMPAVSSVDVEEMAALVRAATLKRVVEIDGRVEGFVLCLGPNLPYESANYRWFCQRFENFVYVDRIVLGPGARRQGLGSRLYGEAKAEARKAGVPLLCEVNIKPANVGSLAFHSAQGFESVGQQDTEGGKKTVTMLCWQPSANP